MPISRAWIAAGHCTRSTADIVAQAGAEAGCREPIGRPHNAIQMRRMLSFGVAKSLQLARRMHARSGHVGAHPARGCETCVTSASKLRTGLSHLTATSSSSKRGVRRERGPGACPRASPHRYAGDGICGPIGVKSSVGLTVIERLARAVEHGIPAVRAAPPLWSLRFVQGALGGQAQEFPFRAPAA